jgi:hypothetical protein
MDIHAAFEEVARWCAHETAAGDPDALEVDAHATVWITVGESAPPWHVRHARRCSSGASAPIAQLRYDVDRDVIAGDREGLFRGLPASVVNSPLWR